MNPTDCVSALLSDILALICLSARWVRHRWRLVRTPQGAPRCETCHGTGALSLEDVERELVERWELFNAGYDMGKAVVAEAATRKDVRRS